MGDLSGEILFEKFSIAECFKKDEHTAVYLADHIFLGKKIILKVLNTETIGDDQKIQRFKREAKIMAKLEHPNIIKVLDFGMFKNYFYISQEYFKGYNLRRFINFNNFSADDFRHIFSRFFSALQYAHENKVIHRDIKPENIFINDDLEVKIGDFGLALSINDNLVTGQFSIVGTPSYMSPEQISGEKLNEKSDLFSSGIVMLELLTGKNPFMGKDINESINNIVNFDGVPDTGDVKFPEFIPILEQLLKKSPKARITSAGDVVKELGGYEGDQASFSSGSIKRELKPKSENRIFLYLIPLLLLIIVIGYYINFTLNSSSKADEDSRMSKNNEEIVDTPPVNEPEPAIATDNNPEVSQEKNIAATQETPENNIDETTVLPGSLFIECFPWADVYIDSEKIDTTPLPDNIILPAGKYNLKLQHPEFPLYETEITILPGMNKTVKVNMDTLFGFAEFNIFPWGEVILNKKSFGHTPYSEPVKLIPGNYDLVIKNPSFKKKEEKITIKRNDTLKVNFNFKKNME